jgi:hypothetical protein
MSKTFNGILMISLQTSISSTSLSAVANATTSSLTASVSGGRGIYTYLWVSSGTGCTITSPTAATTTFTGSSVTGNTSVYCAITDTITGNTLNTDSCTITWTSIPVPVTQNVVISGVVTYNGAARAYTLTGTPASPAPTGTPSSFVNAGTYTYPTNITSITPGSGYTLGSVTGNFVISRLSITDMSFTLNGVSFTSPVSRSPGTSYTIAISSVTPTGATYSPTSLTASTSGTYSLSSSGTGNYTGTRTSPVLTIVSGSVTETNRFTAWSVQLTATLTGATATGYAWSRIGGTWGGAATISPSGGNPVTATVSSAAPAGSNTIFQCIISYSGGTFTATRTIPWGLV